MTNKPAATTPRESGHDELTHNMILPVVAMAVIGLVVIVFLMFLAARWQDFTAAERSIRVAASMREQIHRDLARTVADYARRPDVLANLVEARDAAWADRNVGIPVAETHGYSWTVLVDASGDAAYAAYAGERRALDLDRQASPAIARLIALARAGDAAQPVSGIGRIDGEIEFVAAAPLARAGDGRAILMFMRALNQRFLDELSDRTGLAEMRLLAAEGPVPIVSIPLIAADGTALGVIAWTIDQPGQEVFHKALLMILLASPAVIVMSWVFVKRARDTVLMLIERERALHRERERAEKYLAIVGSIIVALDRDHRITLINDRGCRVLGARRDELIGKNWVATVVPEEGRDEVRALLAGLLEGGGDGTEKAEYEIVTKSGERRLVAWHNTTFRDEAGEIGGTLSSGDDITDRTRIEARARALEGELAHFLRLGTMGEMATGLAHELSQPLAAIKNYAQGCARRLRAGGAKTEELLAAIERVDDEATRAGEIIQRIRGWLRKRAPERAPIDISLAVREVADLMAPDVRRAEAELELDLTEGLPPVMADMIQIEQVILNLARNGLDILAEKEVGERRLSIRTALDDDTVTVSVSDTGRGVDPEALESLFEPFYTTKVGGLGMGLSISRSIIEAHNGRLWAESSPGGGSVFHFSLPITELTAAA